MRDIDVFQQALALPKPWQVVDSVFDPGEKRLDLFLDFKAGGEFACPQCERTGCKAHDSTEMTWRHLNFFQHEAYLHARTPQVQCPECGVKRVQVPWARPGSKFTLLFEALMLTMVKAMPVAETARLVKEHDTRLWRILHHYVDQARAEADFSHVRQVGVDETASKRGHQYISLFVDLEEPKLLFATEGKDAHTLAAFRADLQAHGGQPEQIEDFSLDMSAAFLKGLEANFPAAGITFDKFHIMKLLNKAVDEVRREEQKTRPELKGSRYVWIKNPQNLTTKQIAISDALHLPSLNLKTVDAYHLRLAFQDLWDLTRRDAAAYLATWYDWASHSELEPMIKFAHTLREHWHGVLHWFHTRINNGTLEGLNSLIQAAKAKARGYRSNRNLIAMAYLIAGKLEFKPLPT